MNVGKITGGTAENVVAAHAEAHLDVRVARAADVKAVEADAPRARTGHRRDDDQRLRRLDEAAARADAASRKLVAKAQEHAAALGLELGEESTGGGSDANLIAAHGVPVLDGLGAQGGGAHAYHEHVRLDTLHLRARVLARLLEDPGPVGGSDETVSVPPESRWRPRCGVLGRPRTD